MYEFIRIQWMLGNYNAERMAKCVAKSYITLSQEVKA